MDFVQEQRPNRDRQNANLVPFKPGQSGNPGGRPKGRSLTAILREVLDGDTLNGAQSADGKTVGEKLVEAILVHAINGDASLAREVLNRVDGKVPDKIEQSGGTTIRFEYVNDWRGNVAPDDPPPESPHGAAEGPVGNEAVHMVVGGPTMAEDDAGDGEGR